MHPEVSGIESSASGCIMVSYVHIISFAIIFVVTFYRTSVSRDVFYAFLVICSLIDICYMILLDIVPNSYLPSVVERATVTMRVLA